MTQEVRSWTAESEEKLHDALSDVDWEMFRESADNNVSVFTDVVTSFVATRIDDVVPMLMVKSFPNQKPWVDRSIRAALKERTTTYNAGLLSGDMTEYKAACYKLRRDIVDAKRRYRDKMEAQCHCRADAMLVSELNSFYAHFEASNVNGGNAQLSTL